MASGIKDIAKKDVQVEAKDGLSGSPPRAVESAVRNLSVVASNRHLPTPTMVSPSLRTEAPVQEAVLLKLGRTAMTRRNNQAAGPDPGPKVVPRVRRNGTSSKGRTKSRSRGRRTSSSRGPSHSRSRSRDPHGTVRFQSPPEQEMPGGTWADRVRNGGTPDGKMAADFVQKHECRTLVERVLRTRLGAHSPTHYRDNVEKKGKHKQDKKHTRSAKSRRWYTL
ncbi:hypothetical protein MTO96_037145 [Rhipicephalus appendiculatus]